MPQAISRRAFIKGTAALGVTSMLAGGGARLLPAAAHAAEVIDIAAVQGDDCVQSTIRAVELLGGMGKFVSRQATVGLLINSPWDHPGSYVRPEITLAVIRMCREAGAKEIGVFKTLGDGYWRRSALAERYRDDIQGLTFLGGNHREVPLPAGRLLKKADIARGLMDCDVLIDIPIAKDHSGTGFTGSMKNMMGATASGTNMYFHHGSGKLGWYDDADFLSQCIADLNLARKPDLCIFDGTEVLTTNGPRGPGKILKPQKVFAGVDRVALDVYGANLIGLEGEEIRTAQMGHAQGLGEIRLERLRIEEVRL